MSYLNSRIPDHMAAEVLAEATRLHAQMSFGYSLEDLQQAGLEARIPPEIIQQAVKNVEKRHSRKRVKIQQFQQFIAQQIKNGISWKVKLLIPTIVISGVFTVRPYIEPVLSKFISSNFEQKQAPQSTLTTMPVKEGKLEYLSDAKGLSIAVHETSNKSIQATIGTDNYDSLEIKDAKVGDVYKYKGIYNYQIKIIEVGGFPDRKVTFQIDKQGQNETKIQQLEETNKQIQQQLEQVQIDKDSLKHQLEEKETSIQLERNSMKYQLEEKEKSIQSERDSIKYQLEDKEKSIKTEREINQQQLKQKDKQLEELREENIKLKAPTNLNKKPLYNY